MDVHLALATSLAPPPDAPAACDADERRRVLCLGLHCVTFFFFLKDLHCIACPACLLCMHAAWVPCACRALHHETEIHLRAGHSPLALLAWMDRCWRSGGSDGLVMSLRASSRDNAVSNSRVELNKRTLRQAADCRAVSPAASFRQCQREANGSEKVRACVRRGTKIKNRCSRSQHAVLTDPHCPDHR